MPFPSLPRLLARAFPALVLLAGPLSVTAAELLRFHFNNNGANIVETTPWTGVSTLDPLLLPFGSGSAGLTNGPGLSQLANVNIWGGTAVMKPTLAEAVAGNHFVRFTVQASATKALNLDGGSVGLVTRSGNTGNNHPQQVVLFSSVRGFAAGDAIASAPWINGQAVTLPVSGPAYANLTGPVEFRLYLHRDDSAATSAAGFRLAYSNNDYIALSGSVEAEITLVAPPALSATAAGLDRIDLAWDDANSAETAWLVERSPNGLAGWTLAATLPTDTTAWSDTGLTEASTWFYRVKASSPVGDSGYSPVASATTLGEPPAGAAGLSATAVNGVKIRLDWLDRSANETGFRVERAPSSSGPFAAVATLPADTVSWLDRDALPGSAYAYRVVALNTLGDGDPSPVASVSTPLNFTVRLLIFGNSYSHFYEYLPAIAASLGDTVVVTATRFSNGVHDQAAAEIAIENGDTSAATLAATKGPLETDYSASVRLKTVLDSEPWDVISIQPHSSWQNKLATTRNIVAPTKAYLDPRYPDSQFVFYLTTAYRNDEHLFRNLVNGSAHNGGVLRGSLPYTEDQHAFDALQVARSILDLDGMPFVAGGLALQHLRYHPAVGETAPDPYFDYFNASAPAQPHFPRRTRYGFRWASDGTSNNSKFAWDIDSHPHDIVNYLVACVWYEVLFKKSVLGSTYRPSSIPAADAAVYRQIAHDTVLGVLPPLRLADPTSRSHYGDLLWSSAQDLAADASPEKQAAGIRSLITLYALFPEHPRRADAAAALSAAGRLAEAEALAARESTERPVREALQQQIWNSSTSGQPVSIDLSPTGDPDGDGLPAFFEKALALNPHARDTASVGRVGRLSADGSEWLTLAHRLETARSGVHVTVETSTTLAPEDWTALAPSSDFTTVILDDDVAGDGSVAEIEHRFRLSPSETRRFLRLSVTP